jgi:hypothetical protein
LREGLRIELVVSSKATVRVKVEGHLGLLIRGWRLIGLTPEKVLLANSTLNTNK